MLGLPCCMLALSSCSERWLLPSHGTQASHCGAFSCGSQALECRLSCLWDVESSQTRDWTFPALAGKWTARESLPCSLDSIGFGQWLSLVGEQKIVQEWYQGNYTPSQLGHCKWLVSFYLNNSSCPAAPAMLLGSREMVWGIRVTGNGFLTLLTQISCSILYWFPLALPNNIFKVFCIKLSSIIPSEWGGHLFPVGTKTGTVCPSSLVRR